VMNRLTRGAVLGALGLALLSSSATQSTAAAQTFDGVISDSECNNDHNQMRMGDPDSACVNACIESHGASYVLVVGSRTYALSDQRKPQPFAGQKVTVVGTADATGKRIDIDSIAARQ